MFLKSRKISRIGTAMMAVAVISSCGGGQSAPAGAPAAQGGPKKPQKAAAITVNIDYPERETLSRKTDFAGRIEASQTVKVYPEVSGTVAKTYFNTGDLVNKGDLLFEFDSTDAETALKKAELTYQKTINDIESAESGSAKALQDLKYQNAIESAQDNYESRKEDLEFATENSIFAL